MKNLSNLIFIPLLSSLFLTVAFGDEGEAEICKPARAVTSQYIDLDLSGKTLMGNSKWAQLCFESKGYDAKAKINLSSFKVVRSSKVFNCTNKESDPQKAFVNIESVVLATVNLGEKNHPPVLAEVLDTPRNEMWGFPFFEKNKKLKILCEDIGDRYVSVATAMHEFEQGLKLCPKLETARECERQMKDAIRRLKELK